MQTKRRRWPAIVGLVLVSLGVAAYLAAPGLVRRYITSHYPGVTVGSVEIHWFARKVTLRNVTVDRPNLHAELPLVEADREKNVEVVGGTVSVTLGEATEKTEETTKGAKIKATGLVIKARYRDSSVELHDARVDDVEVCFDSGTVDHPKAHVEITDACVKRDKSFARASYVEIPVKLPIDIPHIERDQKIEIHGLEVEPEKKLVRFERVLVDTWLAVQGPASAGSADDKVFLKAPKVEVNHPWLAPDPVTFEGVEVSAPAGLLKGELGTIELTLGKAHVRLDPTDKAVAGVESCNTWFDVFPKPLPEAMQAAMGRFTGELGFEVRVKPTPKFDLKSTCKFDCKAAPISEILGKPKFSYLVYDAKGETRQREVGPMAPDWTPLRSLSADTTRAFVLLEDPGFPTHRGVIAQALENSLKINVESGEFTRGGSTITMQLARNLWLRRYKSLGRKAEEALLAYALESCLTKEQILELYINVIEFGPDLYGIGPAAAHYFHKEPWTLLPEEAFYLASILPNPKKALPPKKGGLVKAKGIMKALARSGFISEYLVDDGAPMNTSGWETAD